MQEIYRRFVRVFQSSTSDSVRFDAECSLTWGVETVLPHHSYHWKGLERGSDPAKPLALFQYTLAGCGAYAEEGEHRVPEGSGFLTVLPSAHAYYLPRYSKSWSFFWFIIWHPYLVERVGQLRARERPSVYALAQESMAFQRNKELFEGACKGEFADRWSLEEALLSWILALERELNAQRYPRSERELWLGQARELVLKDRRLNASGLAAALGQERTAFARFFKEKTGWTPAAYLLHVRLELAAEHLRSGQKLETLAQETGFSDANHFCKVFREHFGISPGKYRNTFFARR